MLTRAAYRAAFALVPLDLAHLAMVQRTIGRVAARRQIAGGQTCGHCRNARQKQRHEGHDSCEFVYDHAQFGKFSQLKTTHEAYALATRADKWQANLRRHLVLTHDAWPANIRAWHIPL